MGADTKIEWADATFNPWVGCAKISPACTNCYAEGWAKRTGQAGLWRGERRRTTDANWRKPIAWNRDRPGTRVFCSSLADVFEDRADLGPWRVDLFELIQDTPNLTWMLLTKRPEIAAHWFRHHAPPPNVWMGTTVENQTEADRRIPALLEIPARVRFLSMEPLLGPVDLHQTQGDTGCNCWGPAQDGAGQHNPGCAIFNFPPGIHWVIAGGESGPRARPSHPDWFRSLRDQCIAAGVPFHFKQWGEWVSPEDLQLPRFVSTPTNVCYVPDVAPPADRVSMLRAGKAHAGRMLDGRTWDGLPSVQP